METKNQVEITDKLTLGAGTSVDETARVGVVGRAGAAEVVLGANSTIRSHTIIYAGVVAGARFNTGHGALIRENNRLGDEVSVGTNATLEPGNRIGDRCRIHSGCFLENVTLGNDVFVGPNVVFTDDPHPPCAECTEFVGGAIVGDGAAIGGNSTILPGIRIGAGALVGAGSVVTKDVPPGMVVAGNPARAIKPVSEVQCRAKAAKATAS
jgi:acetyltransferase-like isoleucine patch superfamily enzyme